MNLIVKLSTAQVHNKKLTLFLVFQTSNAPIAPEDTALVDLINSTHDAALQQEDELDDKITAVIAPKTKVTPAERPTDEE